MKLAWIVRKCLCYLDHERRRCLSECHRCKNNSNGWTRRKEVIRLGAGWTCSCRSREKGTVWWTGRSYELRTGTVRLSESVLFVVDTNGREECLMEGFSPRWRVSTASHVSLLPSVDVRWWVSHDGEWEINARADTLINYNDNRFSVVLLAIQTSLILSHDFVKPLLRWAACWIVSVVPVKSKIRSRTTFSLLTQYGYPMWKKKLEYFLVGHTSEGSHRRRWTSFETDWATRCRRSRVVPAEETSSGARSYWAGTRKVAQARQRWRCWSSSKCHRTRADLVLSIFLVANELNFNRAHCIWSCCYRLC